MRGKKICCIHGCFSASCYIKGGRRSIFKHNYIFRQTCMYKQTILTKQWNYCIFVKIPYSYFRQTDRLFLGCALFVTGCNIFRTSWKTKKESLSCRKKYIEVVRDITFSTAHPSFYVIFAAFFACSIYPPSQMTYVLNGPYKDI